MEEKDHMRAAVLARRDAMDPEERARKSAAVCRELEQAVVDAFGEAGSPRVAVFASMRSEVDLGAFVDVAHARGWDACFPCMVRDEEDDAPRMAFYSVGSDRLPHAYETFLGKPLRCLACNVLSDEGYAAVPPHDVDVAVVPLVAYDDRGHRLGHGGGNYDRLLPLLRSDALVMGAAFEEQRVPAVPVEPHDQPLPRIVSA